MLVEHLDQRERIVQLWRTLYPEEGERLQKLAEKSMTSE